jgi:hypothetical protein
MLSGTEFYTKVNLMLSKDKNEYSKVLILYRIKLQNVISSIGSQIWNETCVIHSNKTQHTNSGYRSLKEYTNSVAPVINSGLDIEKLRN